MKPGTALIFKAVNRICPISWPRLGRLAASVLFLAAPLRADYLDDVGYRELVAELQVAGKVVPNGAGVKVSQVEADTSAPPTTYAYLADSALFTGVTITNASAAAYPTSISDHANGVANNLFGDMSMGAGITTVTAYLADHWIGRGKLFVGGSVFAPAAEDSDVANFSWVNSINAAANDRIILNRLDYSIEHSDYVAVVAVNNGGEDRDLLASAYNVISVGLTNGNHASGAGAEVNPAVTYPHLVVPESATSYATPVVGAASALLIQTARSSALTSVNGAKSEVIKAVLLAGATKGEFSNWSRTDTSPLDATFGAGELNVRNSYHILTAGEQMANGGVTATGWDFHSIAVNATVTYTFDLAAEGDLSVALTWNAIFSSQGNFDAMSLSLANLDLFLYAIGDGGVLTLVQQSLAAGNVESLWAMDLAAGDYVLKVLYVGNTSGSASSVEYALAWQTTYSDLVAVPEPAWTAVIVVAGLGVVILWRRPRTARGAG